VDYIKSNERLTLGGYLEAHDYYEIGRWLKEDSPYKETVDSLHVLGMSLAGSAAAFVEPLAEAYGYTEERRLFQSVMSLCPVINLKPTIDDMYTNKFKRKLFSKLTWDELQEVRPALHEVDHLLNHKERPDYIEFPNLMGTIVSYYASLWGKGQNTHRKTREIQTIEDLWELNQFSNIQEEIKTPLLVWGSKDDSIVSNKINIATLPQSQVYQNSPQLGVLNVNYGDHCAFATSYGYSITSAFMRSFVLSHSKKFLEQRSVHKHNYVFGLVNLGLEKHLRHWWQAYPNLNYVTINFELHSNLKRPWCAFINIYDKRAAACRRQVSINIPINNLRELIGSPRNSTEAEVISRKLNGLLWVTAGGRTLEGTSLRPSQLEWFDYSL
jgi:predicted alpha/beta-fold hydrolase